ncbi:GMC family oxidoreductase (plasmid) [Agrobacterium leguminum]|uniref:GMC family oxidoreductase n=1 Tax=Agrobacterium leguminum TaxID=2792015 RepID=UPI0030CE2E5D
MKAVTKHDACDVLVIGAGPTGAIASKRFAEEGFSVVCLEQGEYPDYSKLRNDQLEYALTRDRYFAWEPNRRKSPSDYPINDSESDVAPLMWNGVGGSTVIYAAAWHRFKPSDFRVRTVDGVADDWPIAYEDLAPYHDRLDHEFSISGIAGDTSVPHFEVPLPPFPFGELERRFAAAHDRLGWHWWPGTNAIASIKHNNLDQCVRRGACFWGCTDGAKASADRTHWPLAIRAGAKLKQQARVSRIETDGSGLAIGAVYIDRATGIEHFQPASLVVLCANGIGTPRLLLNSASKSHPNGLANSSDMVGRRLMTHPFASVVGLFQDFFQNWQGPYGQRAFCLEFAETPPGADFVRGAKWQLEGTGSPLETTGAFPWGGQDAWGKDFHATTKKRFGRSAFWGIIAEDLPDVENRIMLDSELKDSNGIPAPKMIYRQSENTRKLLDYNIERAKESLIEAGAYETIVAPTVRQTGWHLLGTACMGNDPKSSVVDAWNRCHDVPNLLIMDGSVMPTSSCVNPTGVVTALALRATEAAISSASNQKVSMRA